MELKGTISIGEQQSLTCCLSLSDLKINNLSLFESLEQFFGLDAEEFYHNYEEKESPVYKLAYVVLTETPKEELTFEELFNRTVDAINWGDVTALGSNEDGIKGHHIGGCYSEYTCGVGGFDYVLQENGHSIFDELKNNIGHYVHLKIDKENDN